jgi:hypothetical protein
MQNINKFISCLIALNFAVVISQYAIAQKAASRPKPLPDTLTYVTKRFKLFDPTCRDKKDRCTSIDLTYPVITDKRANPKMVAKVNWLIQESALYREESLEENEILPRVPIAAQKFIDAFLAFKRKRKKEDPTKSVYAWSNYRTWGVFQYGNLFILCENGEISDNYNQRPQAITYLFDKYTGEALKFSNLLSNASTEGQFHQILKRYYEKQKKADIKEYFQMVDVKENPPDADELDATQPLEAQEYKMSEYWEISKDTLRLTYRQFEMPVRNLMAFIGVDIPMAEIDPLLKPKYRRKR